MLFRSGQCVDLIGYAHCADFGRHRGANPARDHQPGQHRPQFPRDRQHDDIGHRAFRRFFQERALDIAQPDVCICGGFTEFKKIAAMASANHVRVIPHMFGTAIRMAATLQLLANLPDVPHSNVPFPALLEYDMSENALRTELAKNPVTHKDGVVTIPQGPGLGLEINRELLSKYAA